MSQEHPQEQEPFAFSEAEKLMERISTNRLKMLLDDQGTTIHKAEVSSNSYGEFLFIMISCRQAEKQQVLTFYGYGLHEYRERWFTDEWAWYESQAFPETLEAHLTRQEIEELLQARHDEIAPYAAETTQTGRGRLFEALAELTDDDAAIAEMDDLGDLWEDLAAGL